MAFLKESEIVEMNGRLEASRACLRLLMDAEQEAYDRVDNIHAQQTELFREIALIEKILELNPNDQVKVYRDSTDDGISKTDDEVYDE